MSRFSRDRRGVSVTVGYVLMLAVAGLLLGVLVTAGGGLLEGQSEQVVDDELTVVGSQLAANIHEADRLAQVAHADANTTAATGTMALDVNLPRQVAGTGYRIEIRNETISLLTSNPTLNVTVSYPETTVPVSTDGQLSGGDLRIVYETPPAGEPVEAGRLEVEG
jgi:FlaG/FlaF family flagellin (archaellin)